jgi:transportin-1
VCAYLPLRFPQLHGKFKALSDQDRVLLYLLECLTSVAQALGPHFQPWAAEVYARCVGLVRATLSMPPEEADFDFAVCGLDLLTGMAEGLGPGFEALMPGNELLELLQASMQVVRPEEVRQSALALLGDLAKACPQRLLGVLHSYMPALLDNLDPASLSVCNNASWAIGEITVKAGPALMGPLVAPILARLVPIVNDRDIDHNLLENTAITIGRLAKVCPAEVGPRVGECLYCWCMSLQDVKDRREKEHAFEGLCLTLQQNPNALLDGGVNTFEAFAWAVASWCVLRHIPNT